MLWLSVACFSVRVSVTFHLTCIHIIFSSVWVYILIICNFRYFPFCFEGCIWVLIASVPGLCILFTVINPAHPGCLILISTSTCRII